MRTKARTVKFQKYLHAAGENKNENWNIVGWIGRYFISDKEPRKQRDEIVRTYWTNVRGKIAEKCDSLVTTREKEKEKEKEKETEKQTEEKTKKKAHMLALSVKNKEKRLLRELKMGNK
jgi:hypothetical protein